MDKSLPQNKSKSGKKMEGREGFVGKNQTNMQRLFHPSGCAYCFLIEIENVGSCQRKKPRVVMEWFYSYFE